MSHLTEKRCAPCEGGVEPLAREDAARLLKELHGEWRISDDDAAISRDFHFQGFYRTMSFVNAVAWIANVEGHHPDLSVSYNSCQVQYTTHSIGGLSENDFICAAKIDRLVT